MLTRRVPPLEAPLTLESFLKHACPAVPAGLLRRTLQSRDARVNGLKRDGTFLLRGGETVALYLDARYDDAPISIVYQDADVLIVDKPRHMVVEGEHFCLVEQIGEAIGQRVYACHRLDANTTGLVALAKTPQACDVLVRAFRERRVTKKYHALIGGAPNPPQGEWVHYALEGPSDGGRARMRVLDAPAPGALCMRTGYRVLENRETHCLAELAPLTGRTHQIRAQCAHMGHPVVGDDVYGARLLNRALSKRYQQLRAVYLCFRLPEGELPAISGQAFCVDGGL